jgi:hypothetical protein
MTATTVIGREEALGSIRALLAVAERCPAALVLLGEAGIGKGDPVGGRRRGSRAAFRLVVELPRDRGRSRPVGLWSVGPALGCLADVAPSLLPLRRRALEVALLVAEPGDEAPDARTIGVALLDVLRVVAEQGAVRLAIDDLQWLDRPSAGALALALRRLRRERIGFLATVREAPDVTVAWSYSTRDIVNTLVDCLAASSIHQVCTS